MMARSGGDPTGMAVEATAIDGLFLITMKQVGDERGVVREFYRASSWAEHGLPSLGPWQQMNVTESRAGALRGLHGEDMFKLVAVVAGEAFGAYVDTRPDSPSIGKVVTARLVTGTQVLVPRGVCNGFQSVTDTQYLYTFDSEWKPGMAGTAVHPLDPELGIDWPLEPVLSEKDAAQPTFDQAVRAER
ncbi:MAG TPA: dTDP-4-dehydrorhamnose 3,5-epimerase [Acidimicrobiales bacterium]|nr:dTDP-4-dehydrorhamnose 3,5-epimerase [Acidimicrobiales bacterium]